MSTLYLEAVATALEQRLARITTGSDEADELVTFVCDEIMAAFHRGELVALSHLRENATSEEIAQSTTTTVYHTE